MTKKRYLVVGGMLAGLVCLGALVAALLPDRPGVTKASFDRIEDGMTRTEVEEIFGGTGRELLIAHSGWGGLPTDTSRTNIYFWYAADESLATITFAEDATVCGRGWSDSKEPLAKKIRRWLHLR